MASNQHYTWAAGHFLFLLASFRYLLAWVFFSSASYGLWYSIAYVGALVSYSIVCYKALGPPQATGAYLKRLSADENSQYLLLAAAWFFSKPVPVSLVPFFVFSLFHTLTFLRTTIIPQLFQMKPSAPGQPAQVHPIAKVLQVWVKANYDTAMRAVAYVEIVIFVRLILGLLVRRSSLFSVIVFLNFARMRYIQSSHTQDAYAKLDAFVSSKLETLPPAVAKGYNVLKKGCQWATTFDAEPTVKQTRRQSGGPK